MICYVTSSKKEAYRGVEQLVVLTIYQQTYPLDTYIIYYHFWIIKTLCREYIVLFIYNNIKYICIHGI